MCLAPVGIGEADQGVLAGLDIAESQTKKGSSFEITKDVLELILMNPKSMIEKL